METQTLEQSFEKYEKLYEAYSLPNESLEQFVERYHGEQELKEAERGMEVYYGE